MTLETVFCRKKGTFRNIRNLKTWILIKNRIKRKKNCQISNSIKYPYKNPTELNGIKGLCKTCNYCLYWLGKIFLCMDCLERLLEQKIKGIILLSLVSLWNLILALWVGYVKCVPHKMKIQFQYDDWSCCSCLSLNHGLNISAADAESRRQTAQVECKFIIF